jgi:hypothetical protein
LLAGTLAILNAQVISNTTGIQVAVSSIVRVVISYHINLPNPGNGRSPIVAAFRCHCNKTYPSVTASAFGLRMGLKSHTPCPDRLRFPSCCCIYPFGCKAFSASWCAAWQINVCWIMPPIWQAHSKYRRGCISATDLQIGLKAFCPLL